MKGVGVPLKGLTVPGRGEFYSLKDYYHTFGKMTGPNGTIYITEKIPGSDPVAYAPTIQVDYIKHRDKIVLHGNVLRYVDNKWVVLDTFLFGNIARNQTHKYVFTDDGTADTNLPVDINGDVIQTKTNGK